MHLTSVGVFIIWAKFLYICNIGATMNITRACISILDQLVSLVTEIKEKDFSRPSEALSQSTIGQHLRHTIEFFICFEQGFDKGIINYDKRAHDKLIESDKFIARSSLARIKTFVENLNVNRPLKLEVGYDIHEAKFHTIETNAMRELVYNIEHAVHHMAIMKIGIREIAPYVTLPADFGVAASTVRYKEATSISSTSHT